MSDNTPIVEVTRKCATCKHAGWSAAPCNRRGICAATGYQLGRLVWVTK